MVMIRTITFLVTQLVLTTAITLEQPVKLLNSAPPKAPQGLRGKESAAAVSLSAASPAGPPERGHFYYANKCEDCYYKVPVCGCRPATEYFACLTKHCDAANSTMFGEKCSHMQDRCSSELDIQCNGPDTVCESKYNQLPEGGLGMSVDFAQADEDAFCGASGKCIGDYHMKVSIHSATLSLATGITSLSVPAPAPVAALAPAPAVNFAGSPSQAMKTASATAILECGLPKVTNAKIDEPSHWSICTAPASGVEAGCDIPMVSAIQAGESKQGYCVLKDGIDDSKKLTQTVWFRVSNTHEKKMEQKKKKQQEKKSGASSQGTVCTMVWSLGLLFAYTFSGSC